MLGRTRSSNMTSFWPLVIFLITILTIFLLPDDFILHIGTELAIYLISGLITISVGYIFSAALGIKGVSEFVRHGKIIRMPRDKHGHFISWKAYGAANAIRWFFSFLFAGWIVDMFIPPIRPYITATLTVDFARFLVMGVLLCIFFSGTKISG